MTRTSEARRRLILGVLTVPIFGSRVHAQSGAAANGPSSADVRALLGDYTGRGGESLGYVAGIIDRGGHRLIAVGQSGAPDGRVLDGDSLFEIGSITKVFTALLMAEMAQRGKVHLDDPVAQYLPVEGRPRPYNGKPITLLDLATHTSGLPRMPTNFKVKDPMHPYANYTVAQLYEFLSGFSQQFYPGVNYQYSNLGFALLGHALALRAGLPYEELLISQICTPLGLNDTRITLTPAMQVRLTPGHDPAFYPFPAFDEPTFAGSGALRSTANDLMRFLDACQGRRETSLKSAVASLLKVRRETAWSDQHAAEGWFIEDARSDELVWKSGGTGGYASYIGYSTHTQIAVVLLSNTRASRSTFPLGRHLLNPAFMPPAERRPIAIDSARLKAYAGRNSLSPEAIMKVTPGNDCLIVQITGHQETEIFPINETYFFARDINANVGFDPVSEGRAPALMLYMDGRLQRAVRVP